MIYLFIVKVFVVGVDLLLFFILVYMIDEFLFEVIILDYWLFIFIGIGMLLIVLLGWFFNILVNRFVEKVFSLIVRDVRNEFFYKIEKLSVF